VRHRLFHLTAFLLAALYASDGVLMHVAHRYFPCQQNAACVATTAENAHGNRSCCSHTPPRDEKRGCHTADCHTADSHAAGSQAADTAAPPCSNENCAICRYLSVQWIIVAAFCPALQSELIAAARGSAQCRPGFVLTAAPRCRAPPVV